MGLASSAELRIGISPTIATSKVNVGVVSVKSSVVLSDALYLVERHEIVEFGPANI